MKKSHNLLSLTLTICIIISMLASFASTNAVAAITTKSNEVFELPDIVDSVEAKENGYVDRVKAEEKDLYTFVFANNDGTNTMRIYSHPVKYIADDGSIHDISLDIEAKRGGGFVTADHEIVTTFESKLIDGITLEYNDVEIMLVPELGLSTMPTAKLSSDGKVVTYETNGVTSFVYKLTYAGFKEDIVVEEYTGQTEYEFTLFTNGLTLCEEYGSYYLADSEGNVEATIGDIIVFTADERNNTMGSMTYETVHANQEYVLTIHLDADYLAHEDTVYPIRIDPTIEINYNNNGAGAIEDVTINRNSTFSGKSGSLYVGRHPAGSLSRVLMRFPKLSFDGIVADQITSATVELRDLMCQGDEDITVECCIYNKSSPAWSESRTTTWSSVGTAYLGSLLDSHVISYGQGNVGNHRYSFNILTVAKAWANGTQNPAKGLVFKANSTFENQTGDAIKTWYKTFSSYNRAEDYKPSLSITYTDFSEAETIKLNTLNAVKISSAGGKKIYKFTPSTSGFYSFESSNIVSGDPYATLYSSNKLVVKTHDDINGVSNRNFRLVQHLSAGQTYYFMAGCFRTGTGSYSVKLTRTSTRSYISTSSVAWGDSVSVSCNTPQNPAVYRFTPSISGEYLFYSSNGTGDPCMWIYNSSLALVDDDDDTAGNRNFRISANLTAGQTYYIVAGHYGTKTGSYTLGILRDPKLNSAVYYLKNIGSACYMDVDGPAAQELVHQWQFHGDSQSRWYVQKQTDGYYTIRSEYGDKKYVGIATQFTGENNIKLYTSITNRTRWKIYADKKGQLAFEPYNAEGKVLYARNNSSGTDLRLSLMSSLNSYCKWDDYEYKYRYSISNYYDQGYAVRFTDAAPQMSEYQRVCSEIFLTVFGIGTTRSVNEYTSCADECTGTPVTLAHTTTGCSGWHLLNNHKSSDAIRHDLISQFGKGTNVHSKVAWTGHDINSASNSLSSNHTVVMSISSVTDDNNNNLAADVIRHERIYTFLHETSHQLGAPDHYCYDSNSNNCNNPSGDCWRCDNKLPAPPECLMTRRMNDLEQRLNNGTIDRIYCSQCMSSTHEKGILNHLNDHHSD